MMVLFTILKGEKECGSLSWGGGEHSFFLVGVHSVGGTLLSSHHIGGKKEYSPPSSLYRAISPSIPPPLSLSLLQRTLFVLEALLRSDIPDILSFLDLILDELTTLTSSPHTSVKAKATKVCVCVCVCVCLLSD